MFVRWLQLPIKKLRKQSDAGVDVAENLSLCVSGCMLSLSYWTMHCRWSLRRSIPSWRTGCSTSEHWLRKQHNVSSASACTT